MSERDWKHWDTFDRYSLFCRSFGIFSKSGGDGVFAGGESARKHPAPQLTEMIPHSHGGV